MHFNPSIFDLTNPVVFFPVRHHSPAAARLVRQCVQEIRPRAILIEGPADFNSQINELFLPHTLPIAIYSYAQLPDGNRRGAFYPYCVYSLEWQALQVGREWGIHVEFIDLPWGDMLSPELSSHRYAEPELRESRYVALLCEKLGIEGLDNLWDRLFEIDPDLGLAEYLERCHQFCFHCRVLDGGASRSDRQRETFMVERIRAAMAAYGEKILVVTGGFHSFALYAQIFDLPFTEPEPPPENVHEFIERETGLKLPSPPPPSSDCPKGTAPSDRRGIALTPFTYERLDGLTGYDAGMPSPGFYDLVWQHRRGNGSTPIHRQLLALVIKELRRCKQQFSVADSIAVEVTAAGLAMLRGHEQVWRQDLLDGIKSALIKEELRSDRLNPFLAAVFQIFRGSARGRLAEGTSLPPLVLDIQRQLQQHDLEPQPKARNVRLDLTKEIDKSQLLHRLRCLGIIGFGQVGGTDFAKREDLTYFWEEWAIAWSPAYDSSCIEAALYGSTLQEAATARLLEQLHFAPPQAETAALLLLDACLMGLHPLAPELSAEVVVRLRESNEFFSAAAALEHLLYLYRYDEVLGTSRSQNIGELLKEAFIRSLWLLDILGQVSDRQPELLQGVGAMVVTFRGCNGALDLNRETFIGVLQRAADDSRQTPLLRGAALGALWLLDESPTERISSDLQYAANPDDLGDFLTGLFGLAREIVQRQPQLLLQLDNLLLTFDDDTFLAALPALRLAFTFFTPREKHKIAQTLVQSWGQAEETMAEPVKFAASPEAIARAMALESKIWQDLERYGLRG